MLPLGKTNVALYCRVSTDDQQEKETIQNQINWLRQWCPMFNMVVVEEYFDDGVSGRLAVHERPAGMRMVEDAKEGRFSYVIFTSLDRFGRKLSVIVDGFAKLSESGVNIRSATQPIDTGDPSGIGKFLFHLLAIIAEWELDTIADRTVKGRIRVSKIGKWPHGKPPMGYTLDADGYLIVDETPMEGSDKSPADLVRWIFHELAHNEGSLIGISKQMTWMGLPDSLHRLGITAKSKRRYSHWDHSAIKSIVRNTIYYGQKTITIKGDEYPVEFPPIVEKSLWERANARVRANKSTAERHCQRTYLLRGLLRCSCGTSMVGRSSTFKAKPKIRHEDVTYVYYSCQHNNNQRRKGHDDFQRCGMLSLPAQKADDIVWGVVKDAVRNREEMFADAQRRLRDWQSDTTQLDKDRMQLLLVLNQREQQRQRVLDMYETGHLISLDEAMDRCKRVDTEIGEIRTALKSLESTHAIVETFEHQFAKMAATFAQYADKLEEATDEQKAKIIRDTVGWVDVALHENGRHSMNVHLKTDDVVIASTDGTTSRRYTINLQQFFTATVLVV